MTLPQATKSRPTLDSSQRSSFSRTTPNAAYGKRMVSQRASLCSQGPPPAALRHQVGSSGSSIASRCNDYPRRGRLVRSASFSPSSSTSSSSEFKRDRFVGHRKLIKAKLHNVMQDDAWRTSLHKAKEKLQNDDSEHTYLASSSRHSHNSLPELHDPGYEDDDSSIESFYDGL